VSSSGLPVQERLVTTGEPPLEGYKDEGTGAPLLGVEPEGAGLVSLEKAERGSRKCL